VEAEYLRSDYVRALRKTGSPMQSAVFDAPELVKVREEKRGAVLQTIINFHEGGSEFVLRRDGSAEVQLSAGSETSNLIVNALEGPPQACRKEFK